MNEPATSKCPFCDKKGLPILPLRPAVARTDVSGNFKALPLPSSFRDGVADIPLPADSAGYTSRLLRNGYLYVFNEKRGEWKAYLVTDGGYLYEFDIHGASPSDADKIEFSCSRAGDAFIARCITISNAEAAGDVWLGFSDTAWTPDVLKLHKREGYRRKHMRVVNVASWVGGGAQPHTAPLPELKSIVNEFHLAGPVPKSAMLGPLLPETSAPAGQVDILKLLNINTMDDIQVFGYPSFDASPYRFQGYKHEADGLIAWADSAAKPYRPMLVCLPDPVGIATELNELVKERARDWAEEPARKVKHESALLIGAVRQAIEHGGEVQTSENRRTTVGVLGAFFPAHVGAMAGRPGISGVVDMMDRAGRINESELDAIHADAWEKYESMYDEPARKKYLEHDYPSQLAAFEKATVGPLDKAYIAWLSSEPFKQYFLCNFDRKNADSGLAFTAILYAVVTDASGRKPVCDYLEQRFRDDPEKPESILCRGLVFNQDKLAKQWVKVASAKPDPQGGWDGMASSLWGGINGLIGEVIGKSIKEAMTNLSNYAYEYSGVMVRRLRQVYDLRTGRLIATSVESRVISLLGAIARHDAPSYRLVTVQSEPTRMQAVQIVSRANAAMSNGGRINRGGADDIRRLFDPTSARQRFQGVLLVEQTQVTRIEGVERLSPEQFDLHAQSSVRSLSRMEAGAHFVNALLIAWTLGSAWDGMKKEPGLKSTLGFAAGVASLTGAMVEGASAALRNNAWWGGQLARPMSFGAIRIVTRAEALGCAGRLLGTLGAVVSGILTMAEGVTEMRYGLAYGVTMFALGLGMAIVGVLIFMGSISGPLGLLIALVLALISYVVGFLKKDDVQKWLDKTIAFGHHKKKEEFSDFETQLKELLAIGKEQEAKQASGG